MTLIELLISTSMIGLTGAIIYFVLNSGLVLFAKNSAINVAHQQARSAVIQMVHDIHSAVSIPQLVDANLNTVTGAGPAAGLSFQLMAGGPFKVNANAAANQNQITVLTNSFTPVAGQRLIIPAYPIELDITAVSVSGSVSTLTLSGNLGTPVAVSAGGNSYNVVCFITNRVYYVVSNGNLNYYPSISSAPAILGQDITNPTPFSVPLTPAGTPNNQFVAAINLSTADPEYSNRSYRSANMFLNAQVPIMARLTTYQ
jgi:type II secretory pathway pseudopilin PulG